MSFTLALLAAALSYAAAEAELDVCTEAAGTIDREIGKCLNQRIVRADERLNEKWKELMDLVGRDSETGELLVDEERQWINLKDASCEYFAGEPTGTMDRYLLLQSCKLEIIEDRVAQLEAIIEHHR